MASTNNADNIKYVGPKTDGMAYVGSGTLPTTASASIADTFAGLGYVSEDGLELSIDRTVTKLKEMSGSNVKTITSEHNATIKLTLLEWSAAVKKELFGTTNVDASGNIKVTSSDIEEKKAVFDMCSVDGTLIRVCVPRLKMDSHESLKFNKKDALSSGITYECLPDESDVKIYIYEAAASA